MRKKKNKVRSENLSPNILNENITLLNNDSKSLLCLVCKELLTDTDPNNVSGHVLSSNHQENLKTLFKMCVPVDIYISKDPNCMKIISNSVFDIALLMREKTSYVHQYENHFVCLICQDIVCDIGHSDVSIKDNILYHLHSEQHANCIKDNVCLVYQLKTILGFLMFHKTVMFCSICKQNYFAEENSLITCVLEHLRTKHPKEVNNVDEVISNEKTGTVAIEHKQQELLLENISQKCLLYEFSEEKNGIDFTGKALAKCKEHGSTSNELRLCDFPKRLSEDGVRRLKIKMQNTHEVESQLKVKTEIAQKSNIYPFVTIMQCSKSINFCLVCKDIVTDLNSDSNIRNTNAIPSHLSSSGHLQNIKLLAYQYFLSSTCNESEVTLNKLALAVNSATICVVQCENYLMCLICKRAITNVTKSCGTIKYDLIYHFGSKEHGNSMRENPWWFYCLKSNEDLVAFQSRIRLFIECTMIQERSLDSVMKRVNAHMQAECEILKTLDDSNNIINQNANSTISESVNCINNCCISSKDYIDNAEEVSIKECSGALETLAIENHRESCVKLNDTCSKASFYMNKNLPFHDSENKGNITDNNLEKYPLTNDQRYERTLNHPTNRIDLKGTQPTGSFSFGEDGLNRHQYVRGGNGLVCYECKEIIEIFNDDPEFSTNLHLEKHRNLSEVSNYLDIQSNSYDTEYTCPVCLEEILIFNKDIKLSLSLHGCNNLETSNCSENATNYDVSTIFNHLPHIFRAHHDFFIPCGSDIYCKLCNCSVMLPSDFEDACKKVQDHVTELYHKEQYNACNIATAQLTCEKVKNMDPWDLFNNIDDPETLSLMNSVIDENGQYIGKCEKYYFCRTCKCCFLYFGNEQEVMKTFASHFLCKNHKKKLERYLNGESNKTDEVDTNKETENDYSSEPFIKEKIKNNKVMFNKLRALPGFHLNSEFLFVQGKNTVYCKLCGVSMSCDKVSKVKKHCYSETHSMILVENASKYITIKENQQLLNATDSCNEKFVSALKKLAEANYRLNNPTVTPNLLYIDNNGKTFVCLACKMNIKFSSDGSSLMTHFLSTIHKQKMYTLNCNNSLSNVEDNSRVNNLMSPLCCKNENVKPHGKDDLNEEKENKNNEGEASIFFEKLPQEYILYRDFIAMEGKNVSCHLCGFTLLSRNNFETDCKNLHEHLSSPFHREQYLIYSNNGLSSGSVESSDKDPWVRFNDNNDFETNLVVQDLNNKNKEYLEKGNIYFMCCLCNSYFLYFDEQEMKNTFAAHCLTTDHRKNLKKYSTKMRSDSHFRDDKNDNLQAMKVDAASGPKLSDACVVNNNIHAALKKALKSPFMLRLNKYYLGVKENVFFCHVCKVFIKFSEDGSHLKKHCYTQTHNNILIQNSINFIEDLGSESTLSKSDICELRFKNVLKMMAKSSYMRRNITLTANLFFISYTTKKFVCLLCDRKLNFSENENLIMAHFISKEHAKNAFELNCVSGSPTPTENLPELRDIVTDNNSELNVTSEDLMTHISKPVTATEDAPFKNMKDIAMDINSEFNMSSEDLMTHISKPVTATENAPVENMKYIAMDNNSEFNMSSEDLMTHISKPVTATEDTPFKNMKDIAMDINSEFNMSSEDLMTHISKPVTATENAPVENMKYIAMDNNSEFNMSSKDLMTHTSKPVTATENAPVENMKDLAMDNNSEFNMSSEDLMTHTSKRVNATENAPVESMKDIAMHKNPMLNKDTEGLITEIEDFKTCQDILRINYGQYNSEVMVKSINQFWSFAGLEVLSTSFHENVDYVCPDCDEVVSIIDGAVRVSFELHYISCHNNIDELISDHEQVSHSRTFIRNIFECLPNAQQRYLESVTVKTDSLYCILCKSFIKTERDDVFESAVQLHFHLSSKFHKYQDKLLSREVGFKEQRIKFRPEIHVFARNNASGDIKRFFSKSENLLHKVRNIGIESFNVRAQHMNTTDIGYSIHKGSTLNEVDMLVQHLVDVETNFTRGTRNKEDTQSSHLHDVGSENSSKLCISGHESVTPHENSSNNTTCDLSDLLNNLNGSLMVHKEFFTLNENRIKCNLCFLNLKADEVECHLTGITHKWEFLDKLKKVVGNESEVKRLMFVKNQLYCEVCQCYISPWSSFENICQGVKSHLEDPVHRNPSYNCKRENVTLPNAEESCTQAERQYSNETSNPAAKYDQSKVTDRKYSSFSQSSSSKNFKNKCSISDPVFQRLKDSVWMLEKNLDHIILQGSNYYCCLCDKGISYSPYYKTLAKHFNHHLSSDTHRLNLFKLQ